MEDRQENKDLAELVLRQARELGALAALLERERNLKRPITAKTLDQIREDLQKVAALNNKILQKHHDARQIFNRLLWTTMEYIPEADRRLELVRVAKIVDRKWYAENYPDVAIDGSDPEEHYVLFGYHEGRDPSPSLAENEVSGDSE